MTPGLTEAEWNAIREALDDWHDDPNGTAKAMFIADLVTRHRDALKGLQDDNARLRTQANDWLDVLVWAADSWPEGQPKLDDAIDRYEPWP